MPANSHPDGASEYDRAQMDLIRAREGLAVSIKSLEREIARNIDWHEWVRRKPGTMLAIAFGVGYFLGRRH